MIIRSLNDNPLRLKIQLGVEWCGFDVPCYLWHNPSRKRRWERVNLHSRQRSWESVSQVGKTDRKSSRSCELKWASPRVGEPKLFYVTGTGRLCRSLSACLMAGIRVVPRAPLVPVLGWAFFFKTGKLAYQETSYV